MKNRQTTQYTIRNVSPQLDRYLRQKAKVQKKALNEVALEALGKGLGIYGLPTLYNDLDYLIGSWENDPKFERAIQLQRQIDSEMWK